MRKRPVLVALALALAAFLAPPLGAKPPKAKGVPPGLAKKGGVPPGQAKKGSLPPGLAKKYGANVPAQVYVAFEAAARRRRSHPTNPTGPASGTDKVLRGGGWNGFEETGVHKGRFLLG